jgi:hypothetical protein
MDFVSHRLFRRSGRRRFVTAMLAGMYIVTAAGLPLPAGNMARNSREMFPCSDHACGCASAEQCWRSCCCHSLAERMKWAREHGVRPPEFAIAEAQRAHIDLAWLAEPTGAGSKSLCRVRELIADPVTCSHLKKACCSHDHVQPLSSGTSNRVIGWKALACQGHSANWLSTVPTLVPVNSQRLCDCLWVEWLGPAVSEHADRGSDLPEIPPPKQFSSLLLS